MRKLQALLETAESSPSRLVGDRITDGFQWENYKVKIDHKFEDYNSTPYFQLIIRIIDVDAESCVWTWGCDRDLDDEEKDAVRRIMILRSKAFEIARKAKDQAKDAFEARF